MSSESIRETMLANAEKINQLKERIHETFPERSKSPEGLAAWKDATQEFHKNFDRLCFPGGGEHLNRIREGNADAIESALCFAECRPYFFRSGYMLSWILKQLKRAPLSTEQAKRFQIVLDKRDEWRRIKAQPKEKET